VRSLQASNAGGAGASLAEVVRLARELRLRSGVTVDFEATSALGQPLVVVRVPGSATPIAAASLASLTPREREIAQLVAAGLSNKEIARQLCLSVGTVKHYVHQILDKTGLRGRVAIATAAQATPSAEPAPPILG
jgi:DNA-binding NarL/FixJ family response regulator